MCAIIGSFDKEKFKQLHALNAYRGELSYSLALFNNQGELKSLERAADKLTYDRIDSLAMDQGDYILGHIQAPTSEASNIHPAHNGSNLLWHNGIVKACKTHGWDTQWMLDNIVEKSVHFLSDIDGSFACVYYDGSSMYIFRNEISPLFIDEEFNISSTQFEGSETIIPNIVFHMLLHVKELQSVFKFETVENPYFFG